MRSIGPRLVAIVACIAVAGCAAGLSVEKFGSAPDFDPKNKQLIVLSRSGYDPDIRRALTARGFTVKRFPVIRSIEREISPTEKEFFEEAGARYGLTVYIGAQVDHCLINEHVKFSKVTFEITDVKENEVFLTVSKGGWTGPCGWHVQNVFEDLAHALVDAWNQTAADR